MRTTDELRSALASRAEDPPTCLAERALREAERLRARRRLAAVVGTVVAVVAAVLAGPALVRVVDNPAELAPASQAFPVMVGEPVRLDEGSGFAWFARGSGGREPEGWCLGEAAGRPSWCGRLQTGENGLAGIYVGAPGVLAPTGQFLVAGVYRGPISGVEVHNRYGYLNAFLDRGQPGYTLFWHLKRDGPITVKAPDEDGDLVELCAGCRTRP